MKNKIGIVLAWSFFIVSISGFGVWLVMPDKVNEKDIKVVSVVNFPDNLNKSDENCFNIVCPENSLEYEENHNLKWINYSVPLASDTIEPNRPKIALVLTNLGRDFKALEYIIENIPSAQTLAFFPFTENLNLISDLIRKSSREMLLTLAMEPKDYPYKDPGPKILLTNLSEEENIDRLQWIMRQPSGFIGFINIMGERFLEKKKNLFPILNRIKAEGYVFLESKNIFRSQADDISEELKLPYLRSHFHIDSKSLIESTDDDLFIDIEDFANNHGVAVVVAEGNLKNLKQIKKWADKANENGFIFIPLSSVYKNPNMFQNYEEKYIDTENSDEPLILSKLSDAIHSESIVNSFKENEENKIKLSQSSDDSKDDINEKKHYINDLIKAPEIFEKIQPEEDEIEKIEEDKVNFEELNYKGSKKQTNSKKISEGFTISNDELKEDINNSKAPEEESKTETDETDKIKEFIYIDQKLSKEIIDLKKKIKPLNAEEKTEEIKTSDLKED